MVSPNHSAQHDTWCHISETKLKLNWVILNNNKLKAVTMTALNTVGIITIPFAICQAKQKSCLVEKSFFSSLSLSSRFSVEKAAAGLFPFDVDGTDNNSWSSRSSQSWP